MGIDRARIAEEIVAPDTGEDLFAVKHAARMAGQQIEQLDLARGAGDALPGKFDAVTLVREYNGTGAAYEDLKPIVIRQMLKRKIKIAGKKFSRIFVK